jgi:hypothetical protein
MLKVSSTRLAGKKYWLAMVYKPEVSPDIILSELRIAGIK